jgi:hypothetical protein
MESHCTRPDGEAQNTRGLGRRIVRVFREIVDALVMITDPERVRETLRLWEAESGKGRVVHD